VYWITGLLGLAFGVAPWVFGYSNDTYAMWTSVILGAAIVLFSGYKALVQDREQKWEYWAVGLVGVLAVVAPFVFGFTALTAALWASIIIGGLVVLLSGYEVFFSQETT